MGEWASERLGVGLPGPDQKDPAEREAWIRHIYVGDPESAHGYEDEWLVELVRRYAEKGDPEAQALIRLADDDNLPRWYA